MAVGDSNVGTGPNTKRKIYVVLAIFYLWRSKMVDIEIIKFLFSVVFILIGSLAFYISALVSGYNIYRSSPVQESTLLSLVMGILVFLLSPVSFFILSQYTSVNVH